MGHRGKCWHIFHLCGRVKEPMLIAFEPSIFNLEFLARNINLNDVADRVSIVPLPLSDKTQLNEMRLTSLDWGGALSTFGNL